MSFLKLGNIFTSAMTGNTALLAIAIASGQLTIAARSLGALLAFICGGAFATLLRAHVDRGGPQKGIQSTRLLAIVFLGADASIWSAYLYGGAFKPVELAAFEGADPVGAGFDSGRLGAFPNRV